LAGGGGGGNRGNGGGDNSSSGGGGGGGWSSGAGGAGESPGGGGGASSPIRPGSPSCSGPTSVLGAVAVVSSAGVLYMETRSSVGLGAGASWRR